MSSTVLFWLLLSLAAVPLLALPQSSSLTTKVVTSTTTSTSTKTSTTTISTSIICASYRNASTACRRRRGGHWLDTPILVSLDEDASLDHLSPSEVYHVEATPYLMLRATDLESSQNPLEEAKPEEEDDSFRVAEPIYFSQLAAIFPALSNAFGVTNTTSSASSTSSAPSTSSASSSASTSTSVVTAKTTVTSFSSVTKTSTKKIAISGCIPAGFTYSKC